tara:strand:+ start:36 stop:863 length:828 start_codon:yes stop_codon:yes gene_type:complete
MKKSVCTIILNRNLPEVTDKLYENIYKHNKDFTDIFVVEGGSDKDNLSKYTTWHADWEEAKKNGLRYSRGMNYALDNLLQENKLKDYDAFLLLTNDTEFEEKPFIEDLYNILNKHKRLGILSPCCPTWGEKYLLEKNSLKFFWFIHSDALLIKRECIEEIYNDTKPGFMNFLFDGSNFRGYCSESELIAKAYNNNWAAGITSKVWSIENESHLINKHELIKTESVEENLKLYVEEGFKWMNQKYGFKSKWSMHMYVKTLYDKFFINYPELKKYQI